MGTLPRRAGTATMATRPRVPDVPAYGLANREMLPPGRALLGLAATVAIVRVAGPDGSLKTVGDPGLIG